MSTEKQLNKRMTNIRESKYTSIQPEYQSPAPFNRPLPISRLLSKHEHPLKQQHGLDWKMDLQMSNFKTVVILSSLANI